MVEKTMYQEIYIDGMTCINCQSRIEEGLKNKEGIISVSVSYNTGKAVLEYDPEIISLAEINSVIEELGYEVASKEDLKGKNTKRSVGAILIVLAIYVVVEQTGLLNYLVPSQLAEEGMGYGMLFMIGLITSVHCIAMCGGINLSQCISYKESNTSGGFHSIRPSFLYNLGRVVSYSLVGFAVGAFGSVFTISNSIQGIVKLIAGVFMVIMGMNMLGIFPSLRRFVPHLPSKLGGKVRKKASVSRNPFVIGILNGFMPCGPLQAMQLYALSTGSPIKGALSMMVFAMGTVPLMLGFGALGTYLSKKYTHKILAAGSMLVMVLGLSMFSQGWSLSGIALPTSFFSSPRVASASDRSVTTDGVQLIDSTLSSGRYPSITLEAGTSVKWTINAPEGSINGCNYRIYIPEYGIEHQFETGENVIEFTPDKAGTFQYSCWMGMIRGTINVVEPGTLDEVLENQADDPNYLPGGVLPSDNEYQAGLPSCCQIS